MKVVHEIRELDRVGRPIVLAIGFFDGVHRGHQAVIARTCDEARRLGGEAWVLTFDPHPLTVIRPDAAPLMLTSTPHKLRVLESLGVDGCLILRFTAELRSLEPGAFIEQLCGSAARLRHVVVGSNWTFGHNRSGSPEMLQSLAGKHGIASSVVPPVLLGGEPVSSTRVRQAIRQAHLPEAAEMLGRPFSVWGRVVHGDRIGHELGFPTANIDPHNEVHLPNGVYAVRAGLGEIQLAAAAYIGNRPTFQVPSRNWVVEVYLLDKHLDLYGQDVEVFFIQRIRPDRRFDTPDELKAQIARDVEETRQILTAAQGSGRDAKPG
ncbi:MAG: bifunctional riboflavin kinase/FAD synthetase [Kiritimatiellae bacterium]|nr:bifunctional riboflavin kinase/FAD synthetase [Kiritimatiellia bacterium]